MPKKIKNCTKEYLISISLPEQTNSYTVISHELIMDMVNTSLHDAGFKISNEKYRATADGQIAQGIYKLNYNSDPELSMMFAWTNSYNKQVRFKCCIGAYIEETDTVMVSGEMGNYSRKHTGTADEETMQTIVDQISNAEMYYTHLSNDKEAMKLVIMNKREQAQMLGILFAEYQILTTEQVSYIRQQMDKPSYLFEDNDSLWAFYNYVTLALQSSHPKSWMEDQRILHYFISTVIGSEIPSISSLTSETPKVIPEINPNQLNLLDPIAEVEAQNAISVFNEVPQVIKTPPCTGHELESEKDIALAKENTQLKSELVEEYINLNLDFESEEEDDEEYEFEL